MRIYRFLNEEFGLKSLREKRLKISNIMELNDPFELLGVDLGDREVRRAFHQTKRDIAAMTGVICFSGSWSNPVLWGHYADSHKGLALGFDIPTRKFAMKVRYKNERMPYQAPFGYKNMKKLLSTKFAHWKYENEYRLFCRMDEVDEQSGLSFYDFSDDLKLSSVIVGMNSKISREEINDAIGENHENVDTFKSRAAFKSFRVVRNKDETLWK